MSSWAEERRAVTHRTRENPTSSLEKETQILRYWESLPPHGNNSMSQWKNKTQVQKDPGGSLQVVRLGKQHSSNKVKNKKGSNASVTLTFERLKLISGLIVAEGSDRPSTSLERDTATVPALKS